jgi:hypothetical protein
MCVDSFQLEIITVILAHLLVTSHVYLGILEILVLEHLVDTTN